MSFYQEVDNTPVVNVIKFLLVESKRYKDVWLRPYELNVGHDDLNKVKHIVEESMQTSSRDMAGALVNNEIPNILTPSSMPLERANIANGWGEKRFKFVLLIEISYPNTNTVELDYIQGYSDFFDISYKGNIDDNMRFVINTVSTFKRTYDAMTGSVLTVPASSFNIVIDETKSINNNFKSNKLMRPVDIALGVASLKSMEDNDEDIVQMSNVGSVNNPELVDKTTILPSDHVATTIKHAIKAKDSTALLGNDGDTVTQLVGQLTTPVPLNIPILRALSSIRQQFETFTLRDLQLLDPAVANPQSGKVKVIVGDQLPNMTLPQELLSEDTAETYDASLETRLSLVIHEAVAVILNKSILNSITFEIDNYNGQPVGNVLDSSSFIDGINLPVYATAFINMFIDKAWNSISNNNFMPIKLLVTAMLESDTTIVLSIDGKPHIIYRYPTFADSKFLPLITNNEGLEAMTANYNGVIDMAIETAGNVIKQSLMGQSGFNPMPQQQQFYM